MIISRKCNKQIPTKTIENLLYLNNDKPRINYYKSTQGYHFPQDTTNSMVPTNVHKYSSKKNYIAQCSNHKVIHQKHREQLRGDSPLSKLSGHTSKLFRIQTLCSAPGRLIQKKRRPICIFFSLSSRTEDPPSIYCTQGRSHRVLTPS